jgi:hypothetical protein
MRNNFSNRDSPSASATMEATVAGLLLVLTLAVALVNVTAVVDVDVAATRPTADRRAARLVSRDFKKTLRNPWRESDDSLFKSEEEGSSPRGGAPPPPPRAGKGRLVLLLLVLLVLVVRDLYHSLKLLVGFVDDFKKGDDFDFDLFFPFPPPAANG